MKKKLIGTSERPRLYVFRSNKHIYAYIIDDMKNQIIFSTSSISANIKEKTRSSKSCQAAEIVGQSIARKCLSHNISKVIFDRGNKLYHGRIKALADSARNSGMEF